MKYNKFIAVGAAIAISTSTTLISQGWFTSQAIQVNKILLDNTAVIPGSGFYTRVATVINKKSININLKSTWQGLDDPYVTRIWNYDNPAQSGNYFIEIKEQTINSSKFGNTSAEFNPIDGNTQFRMSLGKSYTEVFNNNEYDNQEYFARFLVAVGSKDGNKVNEYIEVGLKIRKTGTWLNPIQAQWHIINRSPYEFTINPFSNILEEDKLPELDDPSLDVPENLPSIPEDNIPVPPLENPDDEVEKPGEIEPPKLDEVEKPGEIEPPKLDEVEKPGEIEPPKLDEVEKPEAIEPSKLDEVVMPLN